MPGIAAFMGGRLDTVVALDVAGDRITTVRIILNPDKLARLVARLAEPCRSGTPRDARSQFLADGL